MPVCWIAWHYRTRNDHTTPTRAMTSRKSARRGTQGVLEYILITSMTWSIHYSVDKAPNRSSTSYRMTKKPRRQNCRILSVQSMSYGMNPSAQLFATDCDIWQQSETRLNEPHTAESAIRSIRVFGTSRRFRQLLNTVRSVLYRTDGWASHL